MTKYALCVGTNYRGTSSELRGCVDDAQSWKAALDARGFDDVRPIHEEQATRTNILHWLESTLEASGRDDLAVVTWSGHGTRVPDRDGDEVDGWDEAIVPHDYRSAGMVLDDDLYRLFADADRRGVRVIFVSDSCHSGTLQRLAPPLQTDHALSAAAQGRRAPEGTFQAASYRRQRWLPPAEWMDPDALTRAAPSFAPPRGVSRRSALVLAACRPDQVAYDAYIGGRYRGAFTAAALDALSRYAPDDRDVNYRQWHRQIGRRLPSVDFDSVPQLDGTSAQKRWLLFAEQGRR